MKITLVEYRPIWQDMFEKEKYLLESALGNIVNRIEHIGSTSVIGLIAKPIIDIMVGLHSFSVANSLASKIAVLKYEYVSKYEDILPDRRFFIKRVNYVNTYHLHIVEINSEFWKRHILFRDFLRKNPNAAREYALLKRNLADINWRDSDAYTIAKTPFVRRIEKEASNLL